MTENALPSSDEELGSRLLAVISKLGTRQKASEVAGRSTDQLAKYIRGTTEPPFMPLARLCLATGSSMEWLATGEDPPKTSTAVPAGQSQELSQLHLTLAIQAVEDALEMRRAQLPLAKRAEAIMLVYELLGTGLAEAEVIPIAGRAVGLAQERKDVGTGGSGKTAGG